MINSHFNNNSVSGHLSTVQDLRGGGAMCVLSNSVPDSQGHSVATELIRSTFTNNVAKLEGGAVSMRGQYHNLVINQCIFFNNTAIQEGGGAVHYGVHFGNVSTQPSSVQLLMLMGYSMRV